MSGEWLLIPLVLAALGAWWLGKILVIDPIFNRIERTLQGRIDSLRGDNDDHS